MDSYLGTILLFAGNFAPLNFMFCQGQLLQVTQYNALFSLLGNFYGGSAPVTFALPDLRSRIPIGFGQGNGLSPYALGAAGGLESVTLGSSQIPAHSHQNFPGFSNSPGQVSPAGNYPANLGAPNAVYGTSNDGQMGGTVTSIVGGNQPHENRQPYLALNYIICVYGQYPSRS